MKRKKPSKPKIRKWADDNLNWIALFICLQMASVTSLSHSLSFWVLQGPILLNFVALSDDSVRAQAQHLCYLHDFSWFIWFYTFICLSNFSCELWKRKLKISEFLKNLTIPSSITLYDCGEYSSEKLALALIGDKTHNGGLKFFISWHHKWQKICSIDPCCGVNIKCQSKIKNGRGEWKRVTVNEILRCCKVRIWISGN